MVERGPEKAGVGGSIPSLATTYKSTTYGLYFRNCKQIASNFSAQGSSGCSSSWRATVASLQVHQVSLPLKGWQCSFYFLLDFPSGKRLASSARVIPPNHGAIVDCLILRGQSHLMPKLKSDDWIEAKARERQFSTEMTPRQKDIVQLFAEGRPMKEIAGLLHLSQKTVEFHKHHVMVSFNFKSNADLVLFALNRGLIAPNPELQIKEQTIVPLRY